MATTNHAERYMKFYNNMIRLQNIQSEVHIAEVWSEALMQNTVQSSSGCICSRLQDRDCINGNPRIGIPSAIVHLYNEQVKRRKVPVSWIAAYLHDVLPDQMQCDWQHFQLSHRCIVGDCVNPQHLCWESASTNQSRGYGVCRVICTHCRQMLCHCQNLHDPHCV